MPPVLQHAKHGRQLMQFGHTICSWTLKAHHNNAIFIELARLKEWFEIVLIVDHHGRGLDNIVLLFYR